MSQDGRSQGGGGAGGCGGSGSPASPQGSPITLSVPRPDHQRTTNLYVDTPFKHRVAPRPRPSHHHSRTHVDLALVHGVPARVSGKRPKLGVTPTPGKAVPASTSGTALQQQQPAGSRTPVISKQPAALTFTKSGSDDNDGESIICSWCGRCRCQACTKPRPPPAAWLCRNKCLCSLAAVVDYASCLCCVKAVLYHCSKDSEFGHAAEIADNPCSCAGRHSALGWACLALAAIPMPCLLCYWPLTCVRHLLEMTYQRCTSHGCRCPHWRGARLQPPLNDCA